MDDKYIVECCPSCKGVGLKASKKEKCLKCIPLKFICFACSRRRRHGYFEECSECCGAGVIFKNRQDGMKTIAPLYTSFLDTRDL